jgi:tetratricopeptide (TPR) repeat protein
MFMRQFTYFLLAIIGAALLTTLAGCGLPDVIRARSLARDGNKLYLDGDYKGAIDKYLQAEKIDPETPNLYLNLGYAYYSIFKPDTSDTDKGIQYALHAIDVFGKHLQRNPHDEAARVFQAKILLKAAPFDKSIADNALRTFRELLAKNPDDVEARQYLISLFIDCQRYDDAVAFFQPLLAKNPRDTDSMKILAIIAEKCHRTQDAISWYLKRAEVEPREEKKAEFLYEVGTYAWGLLHYHPDRATPEESQALIETGLNATQKAMTLKKNYAEAMAYTNLLLLKRVNYDLTDEAKYQDQMLALQLREEAGRILKKRKADSGQAVASDEGDGDAGAGGNAPYKVAYFLSY